MYVRRAGTDRPDAKRILSALIQRQPLSQNRHQDLCAAKISWTTHDCVHSRAALGSWCVLLSALLRRGTQQASLSTPQYIVNAHDLILAGSNNENTLPAFPEKRAESIALPFSRSMPACHSRQVQDPDHHGNWQQRKCPSAIPDEACCFLFFFGRPPRSKKNACKTALAA